MCGGFRIGLIFVLCMAFVSSVIVVLEVPGVASAYTVHDPISISGDGGFTTANGVVWGSGTETDPYVIEGWEIEALYKDGIVISGTDAHFIIRNCYVYDGFFYYQYGIVLNGCSNGTLEGNTCCDNLMGIRLYHSSGNLLIDNYCDANDEAGIWLDDSDNNTLNGNVGNSTLFTNGIRGGNGGGIELHDSNNNTLSHNVCNSNSGSGIVIDDSDYCVVDDNTCSDNGEKGIYIDHSSECALDRNTCSGNEVDGIGIFYYSNATTIVGNTCSSNGGDAGIRLLYSCDSVIANNSCSTNKGDGLSLRYSSNGTISENHMSENSGYGVSIYSFSSHNRIWNNTFIGNNGAGDVFDPDHVQAFDDCDGNNWNASGTLRGYGNYWDDWTSPDSDDDGVVDDAYIIGGVAGAKDYWPSAKAASSPVSSEVDPTVVGVLAILGLIAVVIVIVVLLVASKKKGSDVASSAVAPTSVAAFQPGTFPTGAQRFCQYCGWQLAPEAPRCPKCGHGRRLN